jgi:hypothetical protein
VTSVSSTDYPSRRKARTLQFGKLTWIGLMIVTLGWTLLLSGLSLADIVTLVSGHASPAVMSISMAVVAQSTILTGFGLAILGLLQTGFSALNRFFDSVLERTAKRQDFDHSLEHAEAAPRVMTPAQTYRTASVSAAAQAPKPAQAAAAKTRGKIVERGLLKDRAYVRFGDGSIEVETLLGLRRFPSLREATEFIG